MKFFLTQPSALVISRRHCIFNTLPARVKLISKIILCADQIANDAILKAVQTAKFPVETWPKQGEPSCPECFHD